MECPRCRAAVDEDAMFCPHCAFNVANRQSGGSRLGTSSSPGPVRKTNRFLIIIVSAVILLCLIVVSVGIGAYYLMGGRSGSSSLFKSNASEAEAFAKKEFEKHFTKCGDSYFGDKVPWGLVQFKNVTFQVQELNLNEADRLNATEWKGIVNINCDLTRLYDGMAQKWSDWTSKNLLLNPDGNIASYALEKRRGEWRGIDFGPPSSQKKRSCEEIPKN